MKKLVAKAAFLFVIPLLVLSLTVKNVTAATIVSPANLGIWQVNSGTTPAQFTSSLARIGSGSARLATTVGGQTVILNANFPNSAFSGNTKLSDVTRLEHSGYATTTSGASVNQPFVYITISTGIGPDTLTFDPNAQSADPLLNEWQDWDSKNSGQWNSARFSTSFSLADYVSFVNGIDSTDILIQQVKFQVGSASDLFDANVDNFTVGINNSDTTYDFEPNLPTNGFARQFYADPDFQSSPVPTPPTMVMGNSYKNNWGMNSPMQGVIPADNFSARWEGTYNFEAAKYNFIGSSDNKFTIYVDGVKVTEKLSKGPGQGAKAMTSGMHTVRVDYVHGTGKANMQAAFWKTSECYDMNADGVINSAEQQVMAPHIANLELGSELPWDLNSDGAVNSGDQQLMSQKVAVGATCP